VERSVSGEELRPRASAGGGPQRYDEAIEGHHEDVVLDLLDASARDAQDR
jgi:hypothetical protein